MRLEDDLRALIEGHIRGPRGGGGLQPTERSGDFDTEGNSRSGKTLDCDDEGVSGLMLADTTSRFAVGIDDLPFHASGLLCLAGPDRSSESRRISKGVSSTALRLHSKLEALQLSAIVFARVFPFTSSTGGGSKITDLSRSCK